MHVVGASGAGDRVLEALDPHVTFAPHDLDQQPLLGAEVVVQQAAGDARLAGDVIEGRAGDPAGGDADAHRLDDPRRLVTRELPRAP